MAVTKDVSPNSFGNPQVLDPKENELTVVVIETPKGSRNKYAFNREERVFDLRKVLPIGMSFPYDFGFIPSTKAGDGDPLDVLVLMDEAASTDCRLICRIVGIIEAEETVDGKSQRNDRVIGIEHSNQTYMHVNRVEDLGEPFTRELTEFFENYQRLTGKEYRVLIKGPAEALKCIEGATKAAQGD